MTGRCATGQRGITVEKKTLYMLIAVAVGLLLFKYGYYKKIRTDIAQRTPSHSSLIVGTNAEYPPYTFIQNNTIVGFDIDIINEVARRLDKEIELKDMPFDALIPEIQMGTIDVIAAGITATPEREKHVFFSQPYLSNDPLVIVSKAQNAFENIDALNSKTVIVNDGFTADAYVAGLKGVSVTRLPTLSEALLALETDRGDAFITANTPLVPYFEKHGKKNFHVASIPNTEQTTSLAVSKKNPALLEEIKRVIAEMLTDGTIDSYKKKWKLG